MKKHSPLAFVTLSVFATLACADKGAAPNHGEKPAAGAATATTTAKAEVTAEAIAKPHPVLDAYEEVRRLLAADALPDAVKASTPLASTAEAAAQDANGKDKEAWKAVATAATELAGKDPAAKDDVRKQFGEVSRSILAVLATDEALAAGRHAFECPMAQGYKRWVQVSADMANPYMGKRMLECGSEVDIEM